MTLLGSAYHPPLYDHLCPECGEDAADCVCAAVRVCACSVELLDGVRCCADCQREAPSDLAAFVVLPALRWANERLRARSSTVELFPLGQRDHHTGGRSNVSTERADNPEPGGAGSNPAGSTIYDTVTRIGALALPVALGSLAVIARAL